MGAVVEDWAGAVVARVAEGAVARAGAVVAGVARVAEAVMAERLAVVKRVPRLAVVLYPISMCLAC